MRESKELRSRIMRAVKGKDTRPELLVRKTAFRLGYRFRLYRADLPGTPDLVFPSRRKVVFVHGCFWHGHGCKRGARVPKSNAKYWKSKIDRNRVRQTTAEEDLARLGWKSLVVWECELSDDRRLTAQLKQFLGRRAK